MIVQCVSLSHIPSFSTGQTPATPLWRHLSDVIRHLSITKPISAILYPNRLSVDALHGQIAWALLLFLFFPPRRSAAGLWGRACQRNTRARLPSLTGTQIVISKVTRCWFARLAVSDWTYLLTNGHRDRAGRMLWETKCLWPQVFEGFSVFFFLHVIAGQVVAQSCWNPCGLSAVPLYQTHRSN